MLAGTARPRTPVAVVELVTLTPRGARSGLEAFLDEAAATTFGPDDVVFVVGHEPRIPQLVEAMTSTREPPLRNGEAVCVRAPSVDDLRAGKGVLEWRGP